MNAPRHVIAFVGSIAFLFLGVVISSIKSEQGGPVSESFIVTWLGGAATLFLLGVILYVVSGSARSQSDSGEPGSPFWKMVALIGGIGGIASILALMKACD